MAITASQVKELREKTGVGMMECKKALSETEGDLDKAVRLLREKGLARAAKKAGRVAAEGLVAMAVGKESKSAAMVEVNCETDFVTKNESFTKFAEDISELTLATGSTSIDQLKSQQLGGKTVEEILTELIATIGENMSLRRVAVMKLDGPGVIVGYNHMGGKIGSLVALKGDEGEKAIEIGKDIAMHIAAASPKYLKSEEVNQQELDQEREIAITKLRAEGKPEDLIDKIVMGQMKKFYKEVCLVEQPFVKDPNLSVSKYLKSSGVSSEIDGFVRFQLGEGIEKKKENFAEEVASQLK